MCFLWHPWPRFWCCILVRKCFARKSVLGIKSYCYGDQNPGPHCFVSTILQKRKKTKALSFNQSNWYITSYTKPLNFLAKRLGSKLILGFQDQNSSKLTYSNQVITFWNIKWKYYIQIIKDFWLGINSWRIQHNLFWGKDSKQKFSKAIQNFKSLATKDR